MKIIYSPYFGSRPYVNLSDMGGILFDDRAVGNAGLLDELELRVGLKGETPSESQRLVAYVKAMEAALTKDKTLFFLNSFLSDELGTAKVILAWRDALKMAMWSGLDGGSERLRGLAAVEDFFEAHGVPDRWVSLVDVLGRPDYAGISNMEIECRVPCEALPPIIGHCLGLLSAKGIPVVYEYERIPSAPEGTALRAVQELLLGKAAGEKVILPDDESFGYYDFKYGYDAFQAVAGNLEPEDGTVLVTAEPKRLNDTLSILDKPLVGATATGYPQSEQLFLLGLSLFQNPVDINSLTSYLRVPMNPLGQLHVERVRNDGSKYYLALNRVLLDLILDNSGLAGWSETIAEAVYDRDGKLLGKKEIENVLGRIDMWKNVGPSGGVPVDALCAYLKNVGHWADGCSAVTDDAGFAALSSCCSAALSLLDGKRGDIDSSTLAKWATTLVEPVSMGSTTARVGSFDQVSDIRELVDGPGKAIWLGFVGEDSAEYPYDFLSESEKRFVGVPSKEDVSRYSHQAFAAAIASIRNALILVGYAVQDGALTAEHPLMVELRSKASFTPRPAAKLLEGLLKEGTYRTPGVPEKEYAVRPDIFMGVDIPKSEGGIRKYAESATSIQTLILYPFDYVMRYVLGMRPYGEAELQDVNTVKGKVAHLYVQSLVERADKNVDRMTAVHAASFDEMIRACAEASGAVLLLEENGIEYLRFKKTLRESVDHLLDLLRRNTLSVEGTEVELKTDLPVIGHFIAYVDLLLKDSRGNHVIFDLKWNEGSYYYRKVESGNILQLAMYREAVQRVLGGKVSFMGYWVFPKHQIVTFEGCIADSHEDIQTYPASGRDIFKEVCNSYTFRMKQLKRGFIEEGETFPLEEIDYYNQQDALCLYPLEPDYNNPDCKGRPYGNENLTLKGGLN